MLFNSPFFNDYKNSNINYNQNNSLENITNINLSK